jgi:putative peptidoglycan lipid II flippase
MAPLLYNVGIIGVAIALKPVLGIEAAAVGVVVGAAGHLIVQVPALRGWFRWSRVVDLADAAAREAVRLMVPRAFGMGATQITFIVNTALATLIGGDGALAIYSIAFNVLQIPLGVVAMPAGVVLLPSMSRTIAAGERARFGSMVMSALRLLLWISVFLAAVGIVLREPVIRVLFPVFDPATVHDTAAVLAVFLVGLPAHAMNVILARAFYSDRDTITPVTIALGAVAVNVAVSLASHGTFGLQGLAAGIALGGWFEALMLTLLLRRRTAAFALRPMLGAIRFLGGAALAALAALGAGLVVDMAGTGLGPMPAAILWLLLGSAVAATIYLLYSRAMRIPELPRAVGLLRSAVHRG